MEDEPLVYDSGIGCPLCSEEMQCMRYRDGKLVMGLHSGLLFCQNLECYGMDCPTDKIAELICTE